LDKLAAAGLEVDSTAVPIESDVVVVRPAGARRLMEMGERLLAHLTKAEAEVPEQAMWRDTVVSHLALSRWAAEVIAHETEERDE
jgi:hypothetical protein